MTIAMGRLLILPGVICTFALTTHFYIGVYIAVYVCIYTALFRMEVDFEYKPTP